MHFVMQGLYRPGHFVTATASAASTEGAHIDSHCFCVTLSATCVSFRASPSLSLPDGGVSTPFTPGPGMH